MIQCSHGHVTSMITYIPKQLNHSLHYARCLGQSLMSGFRSKEVPDLIPHGVITFINSRSGISKSGCSSKWSDPNQCQTFLDILPLSLTEEGLLLFYRSRVTIVLNPKTTKILSYIHYFQKGLLITSNLQVTYCCH